ncbi:hypothetical protein CJP74_01035 [Psittacicella melopsittaci]|uniref:BON domain-containing protein n=1 Tax=Psittacicella melopsittaci TaxID=2028576 RepID=A0A3A1Y7U0_9GAMM|nr:BON domain-containing protein [Psittacicella melopsittaci]RIY33695.1 hypothetical protein CJP74_01035 [Psittacicella melopsittaci]
MLKKITLVVALAAVLGACTTSNNNTATTTTTTTTTQQQATISDSALEQNINQSIENAYPSSRFPHRITAVVWEGITLLIGQAQNQELADNVVKVAEQVYGVGKILNQIQVNSQFNPTVSGNVSDATITSVVKSKLVLTRNVPARRIKVITQNGIVYLLSKATLAQTETAARVAAAENGVKDVRIVTLD